MGTISYRLQVKMSEIKKTKRRSPSPRRHSKSATRVQAGDRRRKHELGKSRTGLRFLLLAQGRSPSRAGPADARGCRAFPSAAPVVASAFPLGRHASCGCHTDGTRNGRGAQHEPPASIDDSRGGSASRKASAASAYVISSNTPHYTKRKNAELGIFSVS